MAKLPEKNVLAGSKIPRTTTGEMKDALGKLRDYLNELLGEDSADKEAARLALGIDLVELTGRIDAKADYDSISAAIQSKADSSELTDKAQELEDAIAKRGTPVGSIGYFAMVTPPVGYLLADGAAVGRETYPELFDAIGTTFGQGDGETTFNLPDLMGRFPQGSVTPGQEIEAGLPNITGNAGQVYGRPFTLCEGAIVPYTGSWQGGVVGGSTAAGFTGFSFDASASDSIYGASDTVQPAALTLLPCIKAFDAATNPGLIDIAGLANDISNVSANKLDKTLNGTPVKYVTGTFSDGTNWYRQWSDGWLEQGGILYFPTESLASVTLLVPYSSFDGTKPSFSLIMVNHQNAAGAWSNRFGFNLSPTGFQAWSNPGIYHSWYSCGFMG